MRLIIKGETTTVTKPEAKFAAHWATHELLGKRLTRNIICYMEFGEHNPQEYGSCRPIYDMDVRNPRKFKIEINNSARRSTQLQTIFHEFVHLKQWAREELIPGAEPNIHYWRKRSVIDENEYYYADLPWEKEAFRFQTKLYQKYIAYLSDRYISFS